MARRIGRVRSGWHQRLTVWSIAGVMGSVAFGPATEAAPPPLSASAAILVDGNTGQILYARRPLAEYYPASITKIMTAYLAIQDGWHKTVVVSPAAAAQIGSSCYLKAGERLPMPAVVTAMMLVSGNDAAYAVAQTVGGTVPRFVAMMNRQAALWHAPGIHFDNPDGLPDPRHLVSAWGMAIIARHAMANPIFARIVRTRVTALPPDPTPRVFYNQNQLLYTFPGAVGVKIGYTIEADETIVAAARRHGVLLIEVLLHDTPAGLWPDAANLLEWGFQSYYPLTLWRSQVVIDRLHIAGRTVAVTSRGPVTVLASRQSGRNGVRWRIRPNPRLSVAAGVRKNQPVGTLEVWVNGRPALQQPVVAAENLPPNPPRMTYRWWWLGVPSAVWLWGVRVRRRMKGIGTARLFPVRR